MIDLWYALYDKVAGDSTMTTALGVTTTDARVYWDYVKNTMTMSTTMPGVLVGYWDDDPSTFASSVAQCPNHNAPILGVDIVARTPQDRETIYGRLTEMIQGQRLSGTTHTALRVERLGFSDEFDTENRRWIRATRWALNWIAYQP